MADDNSSNSGNSGGPDFSKIVEEFSQKKEEKKRSKHNRTLSLDVDRFVELQAYCKEKGIPVSDVVDRLIEDFLKAVVIHTPDFNTEKKPA